MVHVIPALYQPMHFHHSRCMTATFSQHDTAVCLAPTTPEKSCLHGHCAKAQQVQQLIQVSIKGKNLTGHLQLKERKVLKKAVKAVSLQMLYKHHAATANLYFW